MKKQISMGAQYFLCLCLFFFVFDVSGILKVVGEDTMTKECMDDFQKVTACLNYATGKAPSPTKECCSGVSEIKDRDPKCLCFIIQQTHNGSEQIKSFGIQEAKLLQLPSACNLKNASISYCPKLLGISPSSPDAAIFKNASTSTPDSATPAGKSTPTPVNGNGDGSYGSKTKPADFLEMTVMGIFFFSAAGFIFRV